MASRLEIRSILTVIPVNIIWYSISVVIGSLVPIVLSLVLARTLEMAEFGAWTLFVSAYGLFRPLLTIGASESLRTFFASASDGSENNELRSSFKATAAVALFWSVIFLLAACILEFKPPYTLFFIQLAILSGAAESIMTQTFIAIQYTQGAYNYLRHTIRYVILTLIFCAAFFLFVKSWQSIASARIVTYFLISLLGVRYFFQSKEQHLEKAKSNFLTTKLVHFPFEVRVVAIPFLLRFALERDVSLEEVARFGIASLFGAALTLMFSGEVMFFQELFARRRKSSNENILKFIIQSMLALIAPLLIAATCLIIFAPFILHVFFPPGYSEISKLLPLVIVMTLIFCAFDFFQFLLQSMGRAKIAGIANTIYIAIFFIKVVFGPPVTDPKSLISFACTLGILFLIPGALYVLKEVKLHELK